MLAQNAQDPDPNCPVLYYYSREDLTEAQQLVRELYRDFSLKIPNTDGIIREPVAIFDPEFNTAVWCSEGKTPEGIKMWVGERLFKIGNQ